MKPITDTGELAAFCERLRAEKFVTVDTEFMRDRTYYPKLCLVQLAGDEEAAAVDPLAAGIDLRPMIDLLLDENVLKVMHASRQDMEIFLRLCEGRLPRPVFDTQIAAMVCGYGEEVAYETLVNKVVHAKLDKSSRFTDWSKRPLSEQQLRYAVADVTHLRGIYRSLSRQLRETGREGWVEAEMEAILDPAMYRQDPRTAWQRLKVRSRDPRFVALIQELAAWREVKAQEKDLPRNRVVRDDVLMEIAANKPNSVDELRGLQRVSLDRESARDVVELVQEVSAWPGDRLPKPPAPKQQPRGVGPTVDLLRVLLKHCAEANDVAQKMIASTADLEELAQDDDADVPALRGWRRQVFGEQALKLKAGGLALGVAGGKIRLIVPAPDPAPAEVA